MKVGTAIVVVGGAAVLVGGAVYLLTRPAAKAKAKPSSTPGSWAQALGGLIATVGGKIVSHLGSSGAGSGSTVGAIIPGSVQNGVGVTGAGNLVDVDRDILVDSL